MKNMKTLELSVKGMHCKSCGMLIAGSLKDMGAEKAEASYEKGKVKVTFDEKRLSIEKIRDAIKKEGYEVE